MLTVYDCAEERREFDQAIRQTPFSRLCEALRYLYQAVDRVMLPMHSILIARTFFTSAATGRALVSALRMMIAARSL